MKVLAITNMLPTVAHPAQGTFIGSQIESLRARIEMQVLHIERVESGRNVYLSICSRVRRAISDGKPNVVHAMYGGALAFLAATVVGDLPYVVSICGSDLLGDPQLSWRERATGRLTVWASEMAAIRADAVIAKSQQLAARMPASIVADKIHVIPNGVDLDRFRPLDPIACRRQLGWAEDEFHILFAGSPNSETKRFVDAQRTVECVRARGIPARLQLMRGVSHDEVPVWLNAAHVMLLCSVHEGSPNIVKESLACECPVVATDVGDVTERIEGIEGCHLSSGTHKESLADCLEAVHHRGARLNCRHKLASIALDAIADRVVSVYRGVCPETNALCRSASSMT